MNARAQSNQGQATVLTVVFLAVLLGMAALVLDFGSWYRADRNTQSTADSAALAGAQALPNDTSQAASLASSYAGKNGGGLDNVTFSSSYGTNDTIKVTVKKSAPGIFSKLFGVNSVNVGSKATARTALIGSAKYVAPIVVKNTHPKLLGTPGCPCFGQKGSNKNLTTIPLDRNGAPGAFDLLNLDGTKGGTSGGRLASWMLNGYDGYLDIGQFYSDPGAKWDDSHLHDALDARIGTTLLFPGLRPDHRHRIKRAIPRDRLGRLPPPQLRRPRKQRLDHGLLHRSDLDRSAVHEQLRPTAELRRTFSPANRLVLEQRKTR
jgi:Flp pilus assembly protein TadG